MYIYIYIRATIMVIILLDHNKLTLYYNCIIPNEL